MLMTYCLAGVSQRITDMIQRTVVEHEVHRHTRFGQSGDAGGYHLEFFPACTWTWFLVKVL